VARIGELGTTLAVSYGTIRGNIVMEAVLYSETSVFQEPHDVRSQKMAFFIVTSAKTSNPTYDYPAGPCSRDVMSPVRYKLGSYILDTAFFIVTAVKTSNLTALTV
jgi:hypothetical protein